MTDYKRGDVVLANLDPVEAGEQGKTRPCLVVSYDALNCSKHPCLIVCPITGKENVSKGYPTHVVLTKEIGMDKDSVVMCEQIRAIAKKRVVKRILSLQGMDNINAALMRALDLE